MGRRVNTYQGPDLVGWLALGGMLALALGLAVGIGLGGAAHQRCLVSPAAAIGRLNPVFNPAPVLILVAAAIAGAYIRDSYRSERARGMGLVYAVLQGLAIGALTGWIIVLIPSLAAAGLNARLDRSPPQQHAAIVIGHVISEDRYRTYAQIAVADWRSPGGPPLHVCVNGGRGLQLGQVLPPPGAPVTVTTRRGWLGWEWVSAVEGDVPPPSAPR